MKILKKMMFFIIIGFVILNTQIVKASNITIDDIINDLKESQYVKDKFWTVDIVKNGNSLDVTAVDGAKHKFITSYSFNNDIISFTTKDKSGEYISGYAMNETQVLKFLLHLYKILFIKKAVDSSITFTLV